MGLEDLAQEMVDSSRIDFDKEFPMYGWQLDAFHSDSRYLVPVIGRRGGKTWWAALILVIRAWGTKGDYMIITPQWSQGDMTWKYVMNILRTHWSEMVFKIRYDKREIELKNGSFIAWKSADNPDSLRGYGPSGVIFDEFRYVKEEAWQIIRPALMDTRAWVIFISTPAGKNNLFYKFWKRGMDESNNDWWSCGYRNPDRGIPSYENPYLMDNDIDEIKEDMNEQMIDQEIEAMFLDDVGKALRVPGDIIGASEWMTDPDPNKQYVMGADLGKHEDYTVVFIMDYDGNVVHGERWRLIDWVTTPQKIRAIQQSWGNAPLLVDATGVGDAVFDYLIQAGVNCVPYKMSTNSAKNNIIVTLSQGLENKRIKLPNPEKHDVIKQLLKELDIFTYEISKTGNVIYGAPEGEHDDTVIALALTWYMAGAGARVEGLGEVWKDEWNEIF